MGALIEFLEVYFEYAVGFLSSPSNSDHRLYFIYLISSLIVVYALYKMRPYKGSFRSFLFPESVWSHPSAWLDVRYFFFHGLIGHFLIHGLGAMSFVYGMYLGAGPVDPLGVENLSPYSPATTFSIAALCLILINVIGDFIAYGLHYYQHKIPLLWQFHKVHHSGEVMHPLSNFREHPIDNMVYHFTISFIMGLAWGFMMHALGYVPSLPELFGQSIFFILFNVVAYQLRHSHIWLKWPGNWSKVFPSPAHHQVHHSRHPDHLDKNFAFMFPIWDVIFGTYVMPEDNRDVEFGIVEDSSELNSCLNLYLIPFRDAYRILKAPPKASVKSGDDIHAGPTPTADVG